MKASQILLSLLLALTAPPTTPASDEPPLEAGDTPLLPEPRSTTWSPTKRAHLRGLRVRLNGLGARTHTNWVLFRLPFNASQYSRLNVRFKPRSEAPTNVGALRIGSICLPFRSSGGVNAWSLYTTSGVGRTERFRIHIRPPTDDPTILGINVPTRVANYVACGWDEGDRLRDPENWSVDVEWEER